MFSDLLTVADTHSEFEASVITIAPSSLDLWSVLLTVKIFLENIFLMTQIIALTLNREAKQTHKEQNQILKVNVTVFRICGNDSLNCTSHFEQRIRTKYSFIIFSSGVVIFDLQKFQYVLQAIYSF